jgi:hypothetical protein
MRAALVSVAAAVEFEYGTLSAAAHLLIDAAAELGPRDPAAATARLSTAIGMVLVACDRELADQVVAILDALSPADHDRHVARGPADARARRAVPGPLRHAAATATEGLRLVEDTGQAPELGFHGLVLAPIAAMQGEEGRCHALADGTIAAATERG